MTIDHKDPTDRTALNGSTCEVSARLGQWLSDGEWSAR